MTSYLFCFGRTPELSEAELSVFTSSLKIISPGVALVQDDTTHPKEFISRLGGTIKIAKVLSHHETITESTIVEEIKKLTDKSVTFSVSSPDADSHWDNNVMARMKNSLQESGISARYINPRDGKQLSSVVIEKQHVREYIVVKDDHHSVLAQTVAVQDYQEWIRRDYERPYSDAKHGMLPPKIARIAVNIGLNGRTVGKSMCDPFCGMGTILAEGMLSGATVFGSDISGAAVEKTKKNLEWIQNAYPHVSGNLQEIRICDAVHLSTISDPMSLDAIITEPLLGTPELGEQKVSLEKVRNIIKGLEKLYLGCFRDWYNVLKPGATVFIAFPEIRIQNTIITVKRPIDTCEMLGYTVLRGPIVYGRENAVVRRQFYLFRKKQ